MSEVMDAIKIENDDLICPITLELFRDPVLAKDNHVYEREAITKWILEHGTSPFTREPLQINDLQSDNRLKRLAAQQRNSTVSYNVRNGAITLPPILKIQKNQSQMTTAGAPIVARAIHPSKCPGLLFCYITCSCFICISVALGIIVGIRIPNSNTAASSKLNITSNYSSSLTRNSSMFIRPLISDNRNQYYYKAIQVVVSVSGIYKFRSFSDINMCGYLYTVYFNPVNSSANLLTYDDNAGGDRQFYFKISLKVRSYTLVATTFQRNTTGSFSILVTGPAIVIFQ